MSEILISTTSNPKLSSAFLLVFSDVTFHIETFSTNMTLKNLFLWLFTWKRHLRQCNVKSVENISRRNENNRTPTKKAPLFLVPVWRFQYFRNLLKNPNLKLMASCPNNHYWAYVALSDPDTMKFQQWLGPFHMDWRTTMHANWLLTIFQEC